MSARPIAAVVLFSSWCAFAGRLDAASMKKLCDAEHASAAPAGAPIATRVGAALSWAEKSLGDDPLIVTETAFSALERSAALDLAARQAGLDACPLAQLLARSTGDALGKKNVATLCGEGTAAEGTTVQQKIDHLERAAEARLSPDAKREQSGLSGLKPALQAAALRELAAGAGVTSCPLVALYEERVGAGAGPVTPQVERLCDAEKLSGVAKGASSSERMSAALAWAMANVQGPARDGLMALGPVPPKKKGTLLRKFASEHSVNRCALADLLDHEFGGPAK